MLSLVGIDLSSQSAEAGRFFVDKKYASRGFAVSAMNLLYRLVFLEYRLLLVTATIAASNKGMISWHQHFGMQIVGQALSSEDIRGNGRSVIKLELDKSQWENVTLPKMSEFLDNAFRRFGALSCLCGSADKASFL
jgi:RimJ/RimL family protein N-acetyltransferase